MGSGLAWIDWVALSPESIAPHVRAISLLSINFKAQNVVVMYARRRLGKVNDDSVRKSEESFGENSVAPSNGMFDFVVQYKGDGDCCRSCWYQDSKSIRNADHRCKYEESCEDRVSILLR